MNHRSHKVSTPEKAPISKAPRSVMVDLRQKALEVIALTPEVRNEKVQAIKELIAKGSYHCDHRHLASNLMADHCLMTGRIACQPVAGRQNPTAVNHAAGEGEENSRANPLPK